MILHNRQDEDFLLDEKLQQMRSKLAGQLSLMAEATLAGSSVADLKGEMFLEPTILSNPRFSEYAVNTARRFEDLQQLTAAVNQG